MISRADFDAYNKDVAALVGEASQQTRAQLEAFFAANPETTVAEAREFAKSTMDGMRRVYGDAAAVLAARWYDAQAEANHARLPAAITETTYDQETVDKVARYQAGKLTKGDRAGFIDACCEYVENDTKKNLNNTILANAKRDKDKGVRFARVLTGAENCAFCFALASRGAVYHTRESAGSNHRYHRGCDCKIVPGYENNQRATLVEGHNTEEMYQRYLRVQDSLNLPERWKSMSDSDRSKYGGAQSEFYEQETMNELKYRDTQWLYDGTVPDPVYEKSRELFLEHEKAGVDGLTQNGIVPTIKDEIPDAPTNIDFTINGELWEMKNVTNANSSVSNQIKRARIKWYKLKSNKPANFVFTCEGKTSSFQEIVNSVNNRMRAGEKAIVMDEDGTLIKLEK